MQGKARAKKGLVARAACKDAYPPIFGCSNASEMSEESSTDQSQLNNALTEFQSLFTTEEKDRLLGQNPLTDASAVVKLTAEIDSKPANENSYGLQLNCAPSYIRFSSVVDTFVQSTPAISALVSGCLTTRYSWFFNAFSTMLMKLSIYCPRLPESRMLYPDSKQLQGCNSDFYTTIIWFCKQVLEFSSRKGLSSLLK